MIHRAQLILYVADQGISTRFYERVLAKAPVFDVPGMTEFLLRDGAVLGLMPVAGVRRLLGDAIPDPDLAAGVPRAELYLLVDDPESYHRRAIAAGAVELARVTAQDWGDDVAYSTDPDGHVVAFAKETAGG